MAIESYSDDIPLTIELAETWLTPDHEDIGDSSTFFCIIKDLLDGGRIDLAIPFLEELAERVNDIEESLLKYYNEYQGGNLW